MDDVLLHLPRSFDAACGRWRSLYRAALEQATAQDRVIRNAATPHAERQQAERLRREAEAQLKLLIEVENIAQSDFYSYRYFASEGFLPGYNFPRLPLSAYIPARRSRQRDEFLSRPRFLAISEFGPRSVIYHEGSKYLIHKVILPVGEQGDNGGREQVELPTQRAKLCDTCGYLHPVIGGDGLDQCERCGARLPHALSALFRLQNVATKRRDRINCDEEERLRFGYELQTAIRFDESSGRPSCRSATLERDGRVLARIGYGHAATLWRVNLGWNRRRNREQLGFVLDVERGFWARNEQAADDDPDPMSPRTMRVIPFVEDRRNALLFEPVPALSEAAMGSLQAALKNAIQVRYQLEDNELAAEPLPNRDARRLLLFYEASEGGAGVLRRLLDDPEAFSDVARVALELCHFDAADGEDQRRAPRAREDCEAACYDCLMSYANQRDHEILDRQAIRDVLLDLAHAQAHASARLTTRAEHLDHLRRQCGSTLEQQWLDHLERFGRRLPSAAQTFLPEFGTRPDFVYEAELTVVYIDGPIHDHDERRARDTHLSELMEDVGYTVIRFGHAGDWDEILDRYPGVFGRAQEPSVTDAGREEPLATPGPGSGSVG